MAWRDRWERLWPPMASALLLLLAFPPFNLGLLCFVALVPWLVALRKGRGWRSGYVFGLVYGAGQLYWLGAFVAKWTGSWVIGVLPWALATVLYALYFGLFGWLAQRCWATGRPWLIPVVWAGVEVFRSYLPVVAFPWGILATPLWLFTPMVQAAYFGTIYLISAWCVLVSVIVAMLMEGEGFVRVRPLINGAVGILILSLLRAFTSSATDPRVVTVAQPGVDMAYGDPDTEFARLKGSIQPLMDAARTNGTQLFVLPEGVADARVNPPRTPFTPDSKVPVLFGAQRSRNPSYQSAFAFDGTFRSIDKTRLVIFGEFVPGRGIIPYPDSFRLPAGDLAAGTRGVEALDIAGMRVGPVICFEALFPDIAYRQARNGAQLLAVMSIDDWYKGSPAPDQLMAGSVWRSIENGLPLVRSAATGVSLATDAHGRVISRAPEGEAVGMRVELGIPRQPQGFPGLPVFPVLSVLACGVVFWPIRRPTSPS